MMTTRPSKIHITAAVAAGLLAVASAFADPPAGNATWYLRAGAGVPVPSLALADDAPASTQPALEQPPAENEEAPDRKPSWLDPVSFSITYSLYSDYVSRALNLSEYDDRERREDLNHQMTTSLSLDIARFFGREEGEFGAFTFDTFFEWYAGQDMLDPMYGDHNCQEIDYTVSYSYEVQPIFTTFTVGYAFYAFPNHKEIATQE